MPGLPHSRKAIKAAAAVSKGRKKIIENKIMIDIKHLLKVTSAWISIVYSICFAGVGLIPNVGPGFMMYGLHTGSFDMGQNVLTLGTFLSGLIIWNIVALLAVWLFAALFNNM